MGTGGPRGLEPVPQCALSSERVAERALSANGHFHQFHNLPFREIVLLTRKWHFYSHFAKGTVMKESNVELAPGANAGPGNPSRGSAPSPFGYCIQLYTVDRVCV